GDGSQRGGASRVGKGGERGVVNGGGRAMAATPTFDLLRVQRRDDLGSEYPRLKFLDGEEESGASAWPRDGDGEGPFSLRRYESFEAYATEQSASGNAT
ncbi:unnamed protein product, partial [Ectocarpus fasciculatus]